MTTIIIVVVVALVFFVSLCVVTFMVWKREEEMRTDSLKSIEANLQELGYRMTSDLPKGVRRSMSHEEQFAASPNIPHIQKQTDPFEWTRTDDCREIEIMPLETETATKQSPAEPMAELNVINRQDAPVQAEVSASPDIGAPQQAGGSFAEESETRPEPDATLPKVESAMAKVHDPDDIDGFDERLIEPFADIPESAGEEENEIISDEEILEAASYDDDMQDVPEAIAEDDTLDSVPDVKNTVDDIFDKLAALESMTAPSVQDDEFEIDLEGLDVPELEDGYFTDYSPENIPVEREPMGFDVGRSGRKYTAEELDMLIKE